MTLGTTALLRTMTLLLLIPLTTGVMAGCAARRESRASPAAPSAASPPFGLDRERAHRRVTAVARSLPGLHAKLTACPGGPACQRVDRAVWSVSAQRDGAPIQHGNGFSAGAYLAVAAFPHARAAANFVERIRRLHRMYDGVFSIAVKPGRGRRYTPGQSGVGDLATVARRGWRGWVLDMQRSYTFADGSQSGMELTRRYLARRGRFVCAAYLDARSLTELHRFVPAWRRLLTALGG